jgi:hypothetical protein
MKVRIVAGLFLFFLFFIVGGDAQSPDIPFSGYMRADGEYPIWALEFIKVQPENFALAMQYLDDHWMRIRAEAKRQGAVLDYHLISNAGIVTAGHKVWDQDSIVLLTKYKNMDAFMESQQASRPSANGYQYSPPAFAGGHRGPLSREDLFETLNTQVFVEEPETSTGFKLLTKQ